MKRLAWAASGILGYLLLLIAMAPASVIFRMLGNPGQYRIMAENTAGTFWQGSAKGLHLKALDKPALSLGDASWSLNPFSLLSGRLSADLRFNGELDGHAKITFGTNSIRFRQTDLRFPAAFLAYFEPGLSLYPLQGVLQVRSQDFLWQKNNNLGQAELAWERAEIVLGKHRPLGQYHAAVSANGKNILFTLQSEQDSPLNLIGTGNWSATSGFSFKGSASVLAHEPELTALLGATGQRQADGSYPVEFIRSGFR
ncbi:MAG: type II secretion system protein N [Sulfuricella denitrificans]|nr:type II secretion system protein N [Sulfuricella denitrificans]